jgi:DNA topoisomerase-3
MNQPLSCPFRGAAFLILNFNSIMTTIITDRAGIARQIALALNIDVKTENEGYFQGRGFTVAWVDGAALSFSSPADYGKDCFTKNDLPFIPEPFLFAVRKKKIATGTVTDKSAAKQLNSIKKIFDESDNIIAATDAGEAGELLFRRIYAHFGCTKPFQRLWLNSLTLQAIRDGLKNLGESSLYDNFYAAADCRAKADYLIHINASRAFSLATGFVNHPLGRMMTPTLAMICKRFTEHRKFISSRFFSHHVTLEKDGLFLHFTLGGTVKNQRKAEKIYAYLKTCRTAQITNMEIQTAIQPAPQLYNLTSLQKEANVRYGFSADKTMKIVRKLYEEKLISHPLTESRCIPEDVFSTIPKILQQTAVYCKMTGCLNVIDMENLNRHSVGNMDVLGHHALIPAGVYPGYLPRDEKTVYEMIVFRLFEAFATDCRKEVVRVEAAAGNLILESKQSQMLSPGWQLILNREAKENDIFPAFTEGETVSVSGCNLLAHKTLPPPLYTEASLLSIMEETGLGTSTTCTSVIRALFENGYIERQGKNLLPTEKGLVVCNCLKNMKIADMKSTCSWERMLSDIACGKQDAETFMTAFKIITRQVTEEILSRQ